MTLKKSAEQDDRDVTPESKKAVLVGEWKIEVTNASIHNLECTVSLDGDGTMPVYYSGMKGMYLTVDQVDGQSAKKDPTPGPIKFTMDGEIRPGSRYVRAYVLVNSWYSNSAITSKLQISYKWFDSKGEHVATKAAVVGQTTTFIN